MTSRQRDEECQIVAADDSMRKKATATLTPGPAIDNIGVAFHDQVLPLRIKDGTWRGWVVSHPAFKNGWRFTAEREGRRVEGIHGWWIILAMEDLVRNILKAEDYPDQDKVFKELREEVRRAWTALGGIRTFEEAQKDWAQKDRRETRPYGRKEKFSIVKWHFDQCKELGCKHEDHTPEENLAWVNEKLKTANGKVFASLLESRKMWRKIIQRRRR